MSEWAVAATVYGALMVVAALTQPVRRRAVALAASLSYTAAAVGTGTLVGQFWISLLVPGVLLLAGYWLSGLFFRDPQPWLERWLLYVDREVAASTWMSRMPRGAAELLEASYAGVYVLVGGGAIYSATFGLDAIRSYWTLVLTCGLASYAPLPWLRSRPPRVSEGGSDGCPPPPAVSGDRPPQPALRRLNTLILDHASIQANTLPSGHVAGAVAASLGLMAVNPWVGGIGLVAAGVIAVAAIAGRYHYVVDCVAGAVVAVTFWSLM